MNGDESGLLIPEVRGRHVVAATVAGVLSLALHAAALIYLSSIQFGFPIASEKSLSTRAVRSMRLEEVRHEALPEPDAEAAGVKGTLSILRDLARDAERLAVRPDEVTIEPRTLTEDPMAGMSGTVASPTTVPDREAWEPRQEILSIRRQLASDEASVFPRRRIPDIERVVQAPDIVFPVDREALDRPGVAVAPPGPIALAPPPVEVSGAPRVEVVDESGPELVIGEAEAETGSGLFEEVPEDVTSMRAIETKGLRARVTTYTTLRDFRYGYFRIDIDRTGPEELPVVPKDVILVQDCSASMTEQRIHFCRDGLTRCLDAIGADDRFNIARFRESTTLCFKDWSPRSPEAIATAKEFIADMWSEGNTDIFASIRDVLNVTSTPGRPVIALLVTDGMANTGLTRSSDIIGEFSKLNDGAVSVFAMGTVQTANQYLLDLMSYCNRGDSRVVAKGRWDIPDSMVALMNGVRRPVLTGVHFRFAAGSDCLVYPALPTNLYLDRPLVLYGRYPKRMDQVVFQAVGEAGDAVCDMVFAIPIDASATRGDSDIRTMWARHRIYYLIGEYTRTGKQELLDDMRKTARAYGVKVPYREAL